MATLPNPRTTTAPISAQQNQNFQNQAENQAALQYNSQFLQNQQQGGLARQGAKHSRNQINVATEKALADLGAANRSQRQALPEEFNLRGLYNSGIFAEAVGDLGKSFQKGVAGINQTRQGDLSTVGQNLQLQLSQLGAQRQGLQGQRSSFINSSIDQLRKSFEEKSFRDLQYGNQLGQQGFENQLALQSLAQSGAGSGSGDGSGDGSDQDITGALNTKEALDQAWQWRAQGKSEKDIAQFLTARGVSAKQNNFGVDFIQRDVEQRLRQGDNQNFIAKDIKAQGYSPKRFGFKRRTKSRNWYIPKGR